MAVPVGAGAPPAAAAARFLEEPEGAAHGAAAEEVRDVMRGCRMAVSIMAPIYGRAN